jgi:Sigma-70 region 2
VQTTYGNGSANRSVTLTNPAGTGQTRTATSSGTNSQFVARSLNILTAVEEVPESDDVEKVNLAKAGDLQAFDVLILRHQGMISVLLFRFAGQRADLEDLVQETFIRAFRNLTTTAHEIKVLRYTTVNRFEELCQETLKRIEANLPEEKRTRFHALAERASKRLGRL